MKRLVACAVAGVIALSACGSSSSNSAKKDYSSFCKMAKELDAASTGTHGEDPAAITDPKVMKEVWTKVTSLSQKLRDNAPSEVKSDVKKMVSSIIAMNDVFAKNGYDLTGMAKDVKVRAELAKISGDATVAEASTRFQKFMTKNCGTNAN